MEAESTLISIIVPCYNYGHFIAETLDSVGAQTLSSWECIVVDDGSTDNSREVISSFVAADSRFRYIRKESAGVSAARNTGIRAARGACIQFLDADDLMESGKLAAQKRFLDLHPEVDVVYGDAFFFDGAGTGGKNDLQFFESVAVSGQCAKIVSKLVEDNIFIVSAPLVRASVIERIGGFNEGMKHLEDWEFWLRCALGGSNFAYHQSPESSTLIRRHRHSLSADTGRMLKANLDLRTKLLETLPDEASRRINRKQLATTRILIAYKTIEAGGCLAGFRELLTVCLPAMRFKSLLYGMSLVFSRAKKGRP